MAFDLQAILAQLPTGYAPATVTGQNLSSGSTVAKPTLARPNLVSPFLNFSGTGIDFSGIDWDAIPSFAAGETSGTPDGTDIFGTGDDVIADADRAAADTDLDGDPLTPNWIVGSDQSLVDYGDGTYGPQYDYQQPVNTGVWDNNVDIPDAGGYGNAGTSDAAANTGAGTLDAGAVNAAIADLEAQGMSKEEATATVMGAVQTSASASDGTYKGSDKAGAHGTDSSNPVAGENPWGWLAGTEDSDASGVADIGSVIAQQAQNGLNLWAREILLGRKTINDVPAGLRDQVQQRVDNPPPAIKQAVDDELAQMGPPELPGLDGDIPNVDGPLPDTSTDDNGTPIGVDLDNNDPIEIYDENGELITGDIEGNDIIIGDQDGLIVDIDVSGNTTVDLKEGDASEAAQGASGDAAGEQTDVTPPSSAEGASDVGSETDGSSGGQGDVNTSPDTTTGTTDTTNNGNGNNDDNSGGIDFPNIPPIGGGSNPDTGGDEVPSPSDIITGTTDLIKGVGSSVSSVLNTDIGNSSIGDILSGGINFYGQQQSYDAFENIADKDRAYQKWLEDKNDPFYDAGVRSIPGMEAARDTELNPDARENLRTLNTESNSRAGAGADPEAFGGFNDLRDFEGKTGDWNYGQIERGSDEWNLMTDDAVRMAENASKARGRLNSQEGRDSAFRSYVRAQGDIENLNTSRLNQEMSRRGYDRDTAAGQRGQQAGEQLSASQTRFADLTRNRERAFDELFKDDTSTFDRRNAANAQQMAERDQYWKELLAGDAAEFGKFFDTAGQGNPKSVGQSSAAMSNNAAGLAGASATRTAAGYGALADIFAPKDPYADIFKQMYGSK